MTTFLMTFRRFACGAALLSTTACGSLFEQPYSRPDVVTPAHWSEGGQEQTEPLSPWWQRFDDPDLNALITKALQRNNDLAAAAIKVRKAQLEAGLAADKFIPALSAQVDVDGTKNFSSRTTSMNDTAAVTTSAMTGSLSYEVDLWGKLARNLGAAQWEAEATEEDRGNTALSLVGTTASLYWKALYLKQRIEMSRQDIAYAEKTLALVRVQHKSGATSSLEILEAEESLKSQEASLNDYLQQQTENDNALAILFDAPPKKLEIARQGLPTGELPTVEAGLPAQLLIRRPDLRAAELRLRECLATVDATQAGYLPTLTLTGSLGSSGVSLPQILQNPVGTVGAGLTLPFLQWNEMTLKVKSSQADYDKAVVNFRQTFYAALGDVENALAARRHYADQATKLESAVRAAGGAERLYEVRYRAGAATLQVWLDAQDKRRSLEETLLENRLNRLINQVTLYQALGGDTRSSMDEQAGATKDRQQ
ncbi:efflux transporter outer membrane subunit [Telmatospirillum sp.]|uniref:efflux transporter outer membrane subunit n=1 Tax=Telmatospirillum sp. TaxID=2079197 RepID=UPI002846EF0A|nr:efflux transporter outer membrane subunit [Telmatospirillum sp.]MDR3436912.1 efflux transporter outer membrane subunit [Telmatospirillum sp.]